MESNDLLQAQRQLSEKDLIIYNSELQKKSKSIGLAYFLLIFFGIFGIHKFYIGKKWHGISYFLVSFSYLVVFEIIFNSNLSWHPTLYFYCFISVIGIFLFYDLFTLSKQISKYEKKFRIDLLYQLGVKIDNLIIEKKLEEKTQVDIPEEIINFDYKEPIIEKLDICSHSHQTIINVPIIITIYELTDILNEIVKTELDKIYPSEYIVQEFCPHLKPFKHGGNINITINKYPPIKIEIKNNFIYITVKINGVARLKGQLKLGLFKTRVSTHADIEGDIILEISTIKLNKDWSINMIVNSLELKLSRADISVPIIGNVSLRSFGEKFISKLANKYSTDDYNKFLSKLNIKKKSEIIWEKLHFVKLISSDPKIFFAVKPVEILFKNVELNNDCIKIGIGFKIIIDTSFLNDQQPISIKKDVLPNLALYPTMPSDFTIYVPSEIPLRSLSEIMFNHQIFVSNQLSINIKEFEIIPCIDKTLIKISFDPGLSSRIKMSGVIYLTGNIVYDNKTNSIKLVDIDYELNTQYLPISVINWLLKPIFLEKIKDKCIYNIDKNLIDKTNSFLCEKLTKFLPKYIESNIQLEAIKVENLLINQKSIYILVLCKGQINTKLFSDENLYKN